MSLTSRPGPVPSVLIALVLVLALPWAAAGQTASPVPAASPGAAPSASPDTATSTTPSGSVAPVTLEPVTETGYGISSVAPVGWTPVGNGIRARARSSDDQTLLALQSVALGIDGIWPTLLEQLGLTAIPDPVETRTTDGGFDWALYQTTPTPGLVADLGLAERDGSSYIVMLLATTDEAPTLGDQVFLPAVDAFALAVRPSPTANPAWTEIDVSFPGGAADVTLAGTLTVPTGPGPHPGVVLMSGSGPQDRDESLPGIDFRIFAVIADALAQGGIAVLRYDDRGTARSTGDYAHAVIGDFTADGAAALAYLRTRPEVDPDRAGVLGHSEGGIYAATIAADDPGLAFSVGLAPSVGKGLEVIVEQTEAILRADGAPEPLLQLTRGSMPGIFGAAFDGDLARAEQLARDYFGRLYDLSPAADRARMGERSAYVDAQVQSFMSNVRSEQFLSFLHSDPVADWQRVTAPTLGVFGGKDVQVVADAEAPRLEAALATSGNTDSRVVILPDANHMFQVAGTGAVSEYGSLPAEFTPELLPLLTGWIRGVTGLADQGG